MHGCPPPANGRTIIAKVSVRVWLYSADLGCSGLQSAENGIDLLLFSDHFPSYISVGRQFVFPVFLLLSLVL